jgi:hypothetical protein
MLQVHQAFYGALISPYAEHLQHTFFALHIPIVNWSNTSSAWFTIESSRIEGPGRHTRWVSCRRARRASMVSMALSRDTATLELRLQLVRVGGASRHCPPIRSAAWNRRTTEQLPCPGTLRYFFCPDSGLGADADETRVVLDVESEFGITQRRMGLRLLRDALWSSTGLCALCDFDLTNCVALSSVRRLPTFWTSPADPQATAAHPLPSALSCIHRASGGRR